MSNWSTDPWGKAYRDDSRKSIEERLDTLIISVKSIHQRLLDAPVVDSWIDRIDKHNPEVLGFLCARIQIVVLLGEITSRAMAEDVRVPPGVKDLARYLLSEAENRWVNARKFTCAVCELEFVPSKPATWVKDIARLETILISFRIFIHGSGGR